ncbi:hypothetical protein B0T25DRAFT_497052 [Lasiosphaeria hispida]|uniref:Copper acquisition factor BIM1-like domain-containing protein n=1 Tax=Lasiosphaeria hispida TaxID=260671 RepID=A0AAJ0MF83_9PEZI|nr:hypothetical protein B0T25DRAFT_497052 [Lasiosphaeria hispida]
MHSFILGALAILNGLAQGHIVITYPAWRGNNLIVNGDFPFGMQWSYPCGGISPTQNRTAWPLDGSGAVAFQPGWFRGHASNLVYINLGLGEQPSNYSMIMVPVFQINAPTENPYPGTVCLTQVSLPKGVKPKKGDLASIQIVQAQRHGAALYSCADIIFTDDLTKVPPVTGANCFNSTDIDVHNINIVKDSETVPGVEQYSY